MDDFIWTNSYPAAQVRALLTELAELQDAGFLFHCSEGRCFVVADAALPASLDGRHALKLARDDADEIFEDAVERDAAFCGTWADEDDLDAEAA
jgi:hypothetical protein